MKWILVITAILTSLVAVYIRELDRNQDIYNGGGGAALVIAHPDDEVMFFTPLISKPHAIKQVICLSSGNAEGLGPVRAQELEDSCRHMSIDHVTIIDNPDLQDSMVAHWDPHLIAHLVNSSLITGIDTIYTFDSRGVSGHPNHCAVYTGVDHLYHSSNNLITSLYVLESLPIYRKYIGLFDVLFTKIFSSSSSTTILSTPANYLAGVNAMTTCHKSQMVWFRYAWLLLSRFMYINTFIKIN